MWSTFSVFGHVDHLTPQKYPLTTIHMDDWYSFPGKLHSNDQCSCENHCEDHCLSVREGHHQCPKDAGNQIFKMIRIVNKKKKWDLWKRSPKTFRGIEKIKIPSCKQILGSPICSHSLLTKYLVICRILLENDCVEFCNASLNTELSPAREENTLLTHHNQLSLPKKNVEIVSFHFWIEGCWQYCCCQLSRWCQSWQDQRGW